MASLDDAIWGFAKMTAPDDQTPAPEPPPPAPAPVIIKPASGPADLVLKISIAVAILIAGLSVGYYFIVYLPGKDARAQAAAQAAATNAAAANAAQASTAKQVEAKRAANYAACLQTAQDNYSMDWDRNCTTQSQDRETAYNNCVNDTLSTASSCREQYPEIPVANCSLATNLANSLNDQLKDAKDRCLQQAKDGLLDQ